MIAIGLVAIEVRSVWNENHERLLKSVKKKPLSNVLEADQILSRPQLASTKSIVKQNLFDPQRGAGSGDDAQSLSQNKKELGDLHLLGTVISGGQRYAIVEVPPEKDRRSRRAKRLARGRRQTRGEMRRLALGDTLEGFKLEEIHAHKVVFKKGSSTVDVVLDFSRKVKVEKVKEKVKVSKKAQKLQKARARRRARKRSPEATTAP